MWQLKSQNRQLRRADSESVSLHSAGERAHLYQSNACKVLAQYFDDLELSLTGEGSIDISQLKAIWLEISEFIQAEKNHILDDGYSRLLNRLTRIYTQGLQQGGNIAFAATADDYADVIELVSQAYPNYDYSEAIGHLLHYMNQLYKGREKSWIRIFEQLLSMPDSVKPIQIIRERHLKEIQRWIEEGVDNLFQLRDDQALLHSEQIAELAEAEFAIEQQKDKLPETIHNGVVSIARPAEIKLLNSLFLKRDSLISELENRQDLIDLLDQNIQEFEDKIFATRRACLIRPVLS